MSKSLDKRQHILRECSRFNRATVKDDSMKKNRRHKFRQKPYVGMV